MNVSKRKNSKLMLAGITGICALAVLLTIAGILSVRRMQNTATMIYEHPYTVSNEARAMRSRLLDMKGFIATLLADTREDPEQLASKLEERYEMQEESIGIITQKYLGPEEDTAALKEAMQALEDAQEEAAADVSGMTEEEILQYVDEKLHPKYDAVNDCLITIIAFADKKVQGLEKVSADTASMTVASLALLTIVLPAFFLGLMLRERRGIQEIRYRERLFDILSTNVDDIFFIYNKEKDNLEYISSNLCRITGIEKEAFDLAPDYMEQLILEEDKPCLQRIPAPGRFRDFQGSGSANQLCPRGNQMDAAAAVSGKRKGQGSALCYFPVGSDGKHENPAGAEGCPAQCAECQCGQAEFPFPHEP